ncbi:MAG: hypothetical protein NWR30_06220 [Salibacteraceae bacterium]|jgi:hypothetical protein|nr:hypothetical protein [Salibacteraceae bacterium]
MKEDIAFPKVEQVGVCAVPDNVEGLEVWKIYVVNQLDETIEKVFVNSRGYGMKANEEVKTSELRHFYESIAANSVCEVEMLPNDLTGLNNQYWVSYYAGNTLFDKKFIFVPDSLIEENMIQLPILNKKGILII